MHLPTLEKECSHFLNTTKKLFLEKYLPIQGDGFRKVKVRKKNKHDFFVDVFNKSFSEHKNIFQRSIFANSENPSVSHESYEPFYIFPIDGYKFIYNPTVKNASLQYQQNIQELMRRVSKESAIDIFANLIKQSYLSENLSEGIKIGAEIIVYNIPYYYAIRKNIIDDYNDFSYYA